MTTYLRSLSLRSLNYPSHFLRHRNFGVELTGLEGDLDRRDATFLTEENAGTIRFKAAYLGGQPNRSGRYLRHRDWEVTLQQEDLTGVIPEPSPEQKQFTLDTTFRVVLGLADVSCVSFESVQHAKHYLRHRDWKFFLERAEDDLARKDASFHVVSGLVPVPTPDI